jgi:hypothetical protein
MDFKPHPTFLEGRPKDEVIYFDFKGIKGN